MLQHNAPHPQQLHCEWSILAESSPLQPLQGETNQSEASFLEKAQQVDHRLGHLDR